MKRLALAMVLAALATTSAWAGQCQDDIAKIDSALAADGKLNPEQRQQVEDLRNQAVQLCGAGNEDEGLDSTAQAKVILNIE